MTMQAWGGDLAQLTYGVEQERFLFRVDGAVPSLRDIEAMYDAFLAHGFSPGPVNAAGHLTSVLCDTPTGIIDIKNDFCTHIFEVSFPPMRRMEELREMYREVAGITNAIHTTLNLVIIPGGTQPRPPAETTIIASNSDLEKARILSIVNRAVPPLPFSDRLFPAAMCSTQIHANILEASWFPRVPAYYAVEYLIPLLYSNSPSFNDLPAHCARLLMYRDGMPADYFANAIPPMLPTSPQEYNTLVTCSRDYVRDYSFLAPSRHGTIEFRAGCSQNTMEDILELLALRVALIAGVHQGAWSARPHYREAFWQLCATGIAPTADITHDYHTLQRVRDDLPDDFAAALGGPLTRLERAWQQAA